MGLSSSDDALVADYYDHPIAPRYVGVGTP